jgi:hypothetical protein
MKTKMKDTKNIYRYLIAAARPTAAKTALPIATYVHQLLLFLFSIYKITR